MEFKAVVLACFLRVQLATGITTINNTLVGLPRVLCGPDALDVSGETVEPFEGVLYIKNWRRTEPCFKSFNDEKSSVPRLRISLDDIGNCGMRISRKPQTGEVEIVGVWVFSFHQRFVTQVDKAFAVHCIFQQTDVTVDTRLNVNALTTRSTLSGVAQSPAVALKIYTARGQGDTSLVEATKVQVGDPITFVWSLPPSGIYGLMVKDCFVETLQGQRVKVMHEGCTLDDIAMSELAAKEDFSEVVSHSHAFKFADAEDLWFKCTVTLCNKLQGDLAADHPCGVKTCNKRFKRDVLREMVHPSRSITINDNVAQRRLTVLDNYNQNEDFLAPKANATSKRIVLYQPAKPVGLRRSSFCMRKPLFALITSILVVLYMGIFLLGTLAVVLHFRKDAFDFRDYLPTGRL